MPIDIKIQGYIDNWLSGWDFSSNPFASWEANLEPNLNEYYVKHPFYEQLLYVPKSTIVYAPRGGGKTATRLMVQSECKPTKRSSSIFAVPFTDFSPLIEKNGVNHQHSLSDFLPYLLDASLLYLIKSVIGLLQEETFVSYERLPELSYWIKEFSPHYLEVDYLPTLLSKLGTNMSRQRAQEMVDAFRDGELRKQDVNKYWAAVLLFWKQLSQTEAKKPARLKYENTTKAILETFVDFALTILSTRQVACDVMYFLFDGIDEYAVTKNNPKASANLLSPLLSEMNFHNINNLANKFFLPLEQKGEINIVARPDLLETHEMHWKQNSSDDQFGALRLMLRDRLRAFSAIGRESLRDLCEPRIRGWIDDVIIEKADNSPRNLIRLGYLLFFEHCKEEPEYRSRIVEEEWNAAVQGLRTSDSYVSMAEFSNSVKNGDIKNAHLIKIDLQLMRVFRGDEEISLAPLELDLVVYLHRRRGQLCLYKEIMEKIYGASGDVNYQNEAFRTLLKRLRKKLILEEKPDVEYIKVVPRQGLILENTI